MQSPDAERTTLLLRLKLLSHQKLPFASRSAQIHPSHSFAMRPRREEKREHACRPGHPSLHRKLKTASWTRKGAETPYQTRSPEIYIRLQNKSRAAEGINCSAVTSGSGEKLHQFSLAAPLPPPSPSRRESFNLSETQAMTSQAGLSAYPSRTNCTCTISRPERHLAPRCVFGPRQFALGFCVRFCRSSRRQKSFFLQAT